MQNINDAPTLRSVEEAGRQLGLKEVTIRKWIAARKIGYVRIGRRVLVPTTEISRLIENGSVPALEAR